ncbi:hypothetical protein J2J97_31725 (plasmid) [Rhizobium bangladeshense]|uniref:hypothetical protein n=1 Tax=Rhizobium bangladeshense TaxID=1138189 RepID=UPI001A99A307|nr:hypothetical protein [Rhizobium bangladeshense]QSY98641.1 hypothetical protein J2J97_31725 [Rhizobium bangladeshense]
MIQWLASFAPNTPQMRWAIDELITLAALATCTIIAIFIIGRAIEKHTRRLMTANIEHTDRPFTVSFSPDAPGLQDAYRVDAWVRCLPLEALFFNPTTKRWQGYRQVAGVGSAFINGSLVTFRAVPTQVDEDFLAELTDACESRDIPADLLSTLADMDPNEVFSIVEAVGLVRQFNTALEAATPPDIPASIRSTFRVQRRAIDLD